MYELTLEERRQIQRQMRQLTGNPPWSKGTYEDSLRIVWEDWRRKTGLPLDEFKRQAHDFSEIPRHYKRRGITKHKETTTNEQLKEEKKFTFKDLYIKIANECNALPSDAMGTAIAEYHGLKARNLARQTRNNLTEEGYKFEQLPDNTFKVTETPKKKAEINRLNDAMAQLDQLQKQIESLRKSLDR